MNKKSKFIINKKESEFRNDFHKKVGEVVCSFNLIDMLNHNIYSIMKGKKEEETFMEYYNEKNDKKRRDLTLRQEKVFFKDKNNFLHNKIKILYNKIEKIGSVRNEFAHSYICSDSMGFIAVNPMKYTKSDVDVFSSDRYNEIISEIEECLYELLHVFNEMEGEFSNE